MNFGKMQDKHLIEHVSRRYKPEMRLLSHRQSALLLHIKLSRAASEALAEAARSEC